MANEILSKYLTLKIWDATANSWKVVARTTSYNIELNKETIDVTSFDSDGWKEFLVDLKEWSVSGDALVLRTAESGKINYEQLLQSLIGSDEKLILQMINPLALTDSSDGTQYSHEVGTVYLTGLPLSGSIGDKQTFSFTLQGTGKLVYVAAKYDSQAEAFAAEASFSEGDVILVVNDIGTNNTGYYERTSDGSPASFGDAWTEYSFGSDVTI